MSDFFEQLAEFSRRYLKGVISDGPVVASFSGTMFVGGDPSGVVVHYTADENMERVLRWFLIERYRSQVSAHAIVAREWPDEARVHTTGLPLIAALPTMVVQIVPPTSRAWHARRWVNDQFYGIELVNAGQLRSRNGDFFSWRDSWDELWSFKLGAPSPLNGRWWAPYTRAQVEACAEIVRELQFDKVLIVPERVVGHECVQEDKQDPGPAFPLDLVRDYCLRPGDLDITARLDVFDQDPFMERDTWEDGIIRGAFAGVFGREPDRNPNFSHPAQDEHREWWAEMVRMREIPLSRLNAVMLRMGYAGDSIWSVHTFQTMMGLVVDGDAGPVTRAAMLARARDRGIV